jgi:hypothetical protein
MIGAIERLYGGVQRQGYPLPRSELNQHQQHEKTATQATLVF